MSAERWERVKQIFDAALELDHMEDRVAFLDDACQGDPELRAELERLLAENDIVGSFIEKPLAPILSTPFRPGSRLGPYEILSSNR